ncbi:hypothetical protein CAPTEDRAFT_70307, partial [Capitella teleta]
PAPPPPRTDNRECPPARCRQYCEHGWKKDARGCDICECAEPCPEVMCMLHCEHGFEKDANGCDVCRCRSGPAPPPPRTDNRECPPVRCRQYC